jgi:sodium transport system permease protein
VFTQFVSVYDHTVEIFAVPVLNTIFVFKEVLAGIVDLSHIGITVGTTLVYALVCLFIAVRVFRREDVLFR